MKHEGLGIFMKYEGLGIFMKSSVKVFRMRMTHTHCMVNLGTIVASSAALLVKAAFPVQRFGYGRAFQSTASFVLNFSGMNWHVGNKFGVLIHHLLHTRNNLHSTIDCTRGWFFVPSK